jgi:hypothetical protein
MRGWRRDLKGMARSAKSVSMRAAKKPVGAAIGFAVFFDITFPDPGDSRGAIDDRVDFLVQARGRAS